MARRGRVGRLLGLGKEQGQKVDELSGCEVESAVGVGNVWWICRRRTVYSKGAVCDWTGRRGQ